MTNLTVSNGRGNAHKIRVNQYINFSSIKIFCTAYVLCSLRLFKLNTE